MQNVRTFLTPAHDNRIRNPDLRVNIAAMFQPFGVQFDDAVMGILTNLTAVETTPHDATVDDIVSMIVEMQHETSGGWCVEEHTEATQAAEYENHMMLVDRVSELVYEAQAFMDPYMPYILSVPGKIVDVDFKILDPDTYAITVKTQSD